MDSRKPCALPTPMECNGEQIFYVTPDNALDCNLLVDRMVGQRKITIEHIEEVASILTKDEIKFAISKITGSATGVSSMIVLLRNVVNTLFTRLLCVMLNAD